MIQLRPREARDRRILGQTLKHLQFGVQHVGIVTRVGESVVLGSENPVVVLALVVGVDVDADAAGVRKITTLMHRIRQHRAVAQQHHGRRSLPT